MSDTLSLLMQQIRRANLAYASGNPIMTDTQYDQLWAQLRELDPESELLTHSSFQPNAHLPKLEHPLPILSLDKAFKTDDLKPFLARVAVPTLSIEPKLDGMNITRYNYTDGPRFVTSGDGTIGFDVTHHLRNATIITLDPSPEATPLTQTFIQSFEAIITRKDFSPEMGANPRNTVCGWLNSTEISDEQSALITLVSHEAPVATFDTAALNLLSLELRLLALYSQLNEIYPLDGMILKVQDRAQRAYYGNNRTYHRWAIAWKPPISTAKTTIEDIEWNTSRTGRVVPTIIYSPVSLCGTINTRATANNATWLRQMHLHKGASIIIGKAGEIIPKILSCDSASDAQVQTPMLCPSCQTLLTTSGVDLICENASCPARGIERVTHFYSNAGLPIIGLGAIRISQLLRVIPALADKPWLLLGTPHNPSLMELVRGVFGTAVTKALISEITNLSGTRTQAHLITALGIPKIGLTSARKYLTQLASAKSLSGFPPALVASLPQLYDALTYCHDHHFIFAPLEALTSRTFCITGEFPVSRDEMIHNLTQAGYTFTPSITNATRYLFVADPQSTSNKVKAAQKRGIQFLTWANYQTILTQPKEPTA